MCSSCMRPGYGRSVQRNLTPRTTACVVAGSLRLRGTVEAWVMLQHANVLLNPFCQRLDRRYGAPSALLQNRFVSALFLSPKSRGACPGLASRPRGRSRRSPCCERESTGSSRASSSCTGLARRRAPGGPGTGDEGDYTIYLLFISKYTYIYISIYPSIYI